MPPDEPTGRGFWDTLRIQTVPSRAARIDRFERDGAGLIDEVLGDRTSRHLVFLHGWGGNREALRGIGTLFQHTHTVHLLDLPGFGEASPPPADWDTVRYTDLVQEYLRARLEGSVVLVGHSFGGRLAVRLAARQVPQVEGLVLIGVPGLPQPAFTWKAVRRVWVRALRKIAFALRPIVGARGLDWHTRTFGSADYLAAGAMRRVLVRVVNEDLTDSARQIRCPTLLLWGTDDREAPAWLAERYQALIGRHATLVWLPHKDHHPFVGTGGHLCGQKIRAWLEAAADV